MSEKRKPELILLLRKEGKERSNKVELFRSNLFGDTARKRYRLRVNGKWFPKEQKQYFTIWQFRDILFRSIKQL